MIFWENLGYVMAHMPAVSLFIRNATVTNWSVLVLGRCTRGTDWIYNYPTTGVHTWLTWVYNDPAANVLLTYRLPPGTDWIYNDPPTDVYSLEQVRVLESTGSTMIRWQVYHTIPKPKVYNDLKWDIYNDALNIQRPNKRTSILKQARK